MAMISATSQPRVTFGTIVLNGQPFLEYNLRSLYPFAHQIIVVEGACTAAAVTATPDGHSVDGTLAMLERFKREQDPEDKLVIVTAEDEGAPDGFWTEKLEMSQAYAARATGDWLWQVDYDEFYIEGDVRTVLDMVISDPEIAGMSFPFLNFWGGFDYREDGQWFRYNFPCVHRLFRWGEGYRYVNSRPPTVEDNLGRDTRTLNWVPHQRLRRSGIYMYHYSTIFPKQAREKMGYYPKVTWSRAFAQMAHMDGWIADSYYGLKHPYHLSVLGLSMPAWLERYLGGHPAQIVRMRQDLASGTLEEALRPTEDLEQLLSSPAYKIGRWALRVQLFVVWNVKQPYASLRRLIRGWVGRWILRRKRL